ncbi:MAG: AMP-binding protein, partial [Caldimonas sp.]
MSEPAASLDRYAETYAVFRWAVPERFNIAEVCCTRWAHATPDAVAIRWEHEDGRRAMYTYADLHCDANRLAHALARLGVARGDRVAIVMPQRFETAVAQIALYRLGAVAMPLSMLFGPDALEYRINHSEARLAIADESGIANVLASRALCPGLEIVLAVGAAEGQGDVSWSTALAAELPTFDPVATRADDAAVLIYTSGTTGPPKGALIPHRALIGNLSGFVASQNWFGYDLFNDAAPLARSAPIRPSSLATREREMGGVDTGPRPSRREPKTQSVFWSPADWAWAGGLIDSLWPTLYFGREIVAYQG